MDNLPADSERPAPQSPPPMMHPHAGPNPLSFPDHAPAALLKLREELKKPRGVLGRGLTILVVAAVAMTAYLLLPASMGELPRRAVAIFVIAAALWVSEIIPLYATSLVVIGLEILLLAEKGGWAPEGGLSYADFLKPFGSSVIILFMGGFLMSAAISKHGIDRVIAARLLWPFMARPMALIFAVLGGSAFMSMWMSNTATAAMMLAVVAPLLDFHGENKRFSVGLILAAAFGANVGGIGTPIGSPPNAVALAAIRNAGIQISFLDWMLMAVPLALILCAVTGLILYLLFKPRGRLSLPAFEPPARLTWRGHATLIVMGLAIAGWLTSAWHGVDDAVIAVAAAAILTALIVLDRDDVNSIEWDVLLLMWGGLSLGAAMESTGLLGHVVALPLFQQTGWTMALVIVATGIVLSTFMSNTAASNLLIPVAMALSADERGRLAVLAGLSVSFAMALPISTPPNAMAFATGHVPASAMAKAGIVVGLVSAAVMLLGHQVVLPLVLGL